MSFRWHTRALLALGSGAALALSFPNYNLSLLAWISVGMLVLASCGARPLASPLYGFLHGLVFYPIGLPWIDVGDAAVRGRRSVDFRRHFGADGNRGRNRLLGFFRRASLWHPERATRWRARSRRAFG